MTDIPFEGGAWTERVAPAKRAERHAAARMLARLAGGDRDGLRCALLALGLVADPLHKPPTSRDKHYTSGRTDA